MISYRSRDRVSDVVGRSNNIHYDNQAANQDPRCKKYGEALAAEARIADSTEGEQSGEDQSSIKAQVDDRKDESSVNRCGVIIREGCRYARCYIQILPNN